MLRKIMLSMLFIMSLFCGASTLCYAKSDLVFQDVQGRSINLQNKWIILNYWAAWCDACIEEMPELNSFYRNNHNSNVVLIGVNFDQLAPSQLRTAIRQAKINFPVLMNDPNTVFNLGDIDAVPMTFIINPQGKVVNAIAGTNTEASLSNTMRALLANH